MIDAVCDAPRRADRRRGLTMVELLITMSIIGILASMVLFAMSTAQESARVARTEATIATLHALVMEQYESYRTRRLPIERDDSTETAAQFRKRRVDALRELMRREMPDCWDDIADAYPAMFPAGTMRKNSPVTGTALMQAYKRRHDAGTPTTDYQGAECLYMLITFSNPEARSLFSDSQIGDVDGDGYPEFLDGWGKPIDFIRWPADFVSDLQSVVPDPSNAGAMIGDPVNDHDPFDPLRVYSEAYRLVPLIYSAGPDGEYNIVASGSGSSNPYDVNSGTKKRGAPYDDSSSGHIDNIHNHLIGAR